MLIDQCQSCIGMRGRDLKQLRKIRNMKQAHLASLLGINQTTVSRWESEEINIPKSYEAELHTIFYGNNSSIIEDPIARLVSTSSLRVHLICDRTHRLLAASASRIAEWTIPFTDLLGRSLLPFATPEILKAEASLKESGWDRCLGGRALISTGANQDQEVVIRMGQAVWERVLMSNGSIGRVVTTLDSS